MDELIALYHSLNISGEDVELMVRILFQVMLLTGSAIFSGSETALFSLSRIDLQKLRQTHHPHSENIHAMLDEPRRLIISILCGNELVNIASAVNMTAILLIIFTGEDIGWINILIMVPLLLLVGEVTPKTIAVSFPIKFVTGVTAHFLPRWIIFITPLREAVRFVSDRITTLIVGDEVNKENILQRDEFRTLLEEGEETGIIDATERVLIDNMLEAAETEISRIMTPSLRIYFLDASLSVQDLVKRFREIGHPRVPVYRGHWDNVIGFIHSEDILRLVRGGGDLEQVTLDTILRPAHFLPPTKKVDEMFDYFQAHNTRAAIILGEYGEILGVVTMKDVLKFFFGEISGKMEGQELYKENDENSYIVPGDMRLSDFYNLTNFDIEDPVMSTIGGVAFRVFDRLPKVGDKVTFGGYQFTALEIQGLRLSQLQVRRFSDNEHSQVKATNEQEISKASVRSSEAGQEEDSQLALIESREDVGSMDADISEEVGAVRLERDK